MRNREERNRERERKREMKVGHGLMGQRKDIVQVANKQEKAMLGI